MKRKNTFSILAAAAIAVLSATSDVFAIAPNGVPVVPEPSTFLLMAVGAAGLGGYVWRRGRKK